MMLKPARLMLALIAVVAAPAFAQNAATVNGKAIPAAKVDQMVKQVVAQGQQPDSPQLREAVKKELISREVMLQEADKQGYGKKAEVTSAIDNARQSIIINAMLADYVKKNPVKDAEIQAEYDKYKAAVGPTEYHSRHILVATEQEAKDIIAKLKAGGKFEELAKVSKDGSANNGGDLGWMTPGKLVKPFADAMIALKNGEITQTPVKTEFGFHVIKLEESRPTQLPPLAEVKGQVAEALQQRKIAAYREELLKKAKIQ
ncbi:MULTISPECIES: peptidylprolyl isomerase [unclassified Duganella]|jgi:peptidyl-prolyl cis-trans isomerase C|uniref:peptidylprolyl isomerase n=1 Tax=unclassified Duganella TaxID=2636909 RepID=UPI00087EBBB9|nr:MULTISPECIES: peptidylprolyl isomerase [unclassified Duganella]SDG80686.1 peptidyl-prolyl cis-trans isomerase C [Duganella sp. OV458]SDK07922.1 peptidyl-prolyl cis-trans isomerase C [Duganella sp. OV510]